MRNRNSAAALTLLNAARDEAQEAPTLRGSMRLLEATVRFHQGDEQGIVDLLEEAAKLLSAETISRGRVLDALGMWFAGCSFSESCTLRGAGPEVIEWTCRFAVRSGL